MKNRWRALALACAALLGLTGCASGQAGSAGEPEAVDLGAYAAYVNTDVLDPAAQQALYEACYAPVDQTVSAGGYKFTIRSLFSDGQGFAADCVLAPESGQWDQALLDTLLDGQVKHLYAGTYDLVDADHFVQEEDGAVSFQFQMWLDRDVLGGDGGDLSASLHLYGLYDLWDTPLLEGDWTFDLDFGAPQALRYAGDYSFEAGGHTVTVTEVALLPSYAEVRYTVAGADTGFDSTLVALNGLTLADGAQRPASRQGGWSRETEEGLSGASTGRQTRLLDPAAVTAVQVGQETVELSRLEPVSGPDA